MKEQKSIATIVFGWLSILSGLFGFLYIVSGFFLPIEMFKNIDLSIPLSSLAALLIGVNLLRGRNWARLLITFQCTVALAFGLYKFFTVKITTQMLGYFVLVSIFYFMLFGSGLYHFTRLETKERFK